jgi:hypothetical protein
VLRRMSTRVKKAVQNVRWDTERCYQNRARFGDRTINHRKLIMEITAFITSIFLLVYVGRRRHVGALSLYSVFIAFQMLYNIVPWILYTIHFSIFSLQSDQGLLLTQLWMATASNLCFGGVYLFFYRRTPLKALPPLPESMRGRYFLLAVPVFVLACALATTYGWREITTADTSGLSGGAGIMFVITAYVKFWCIGIYLYYLYRFGLDKWAWRLLGLHVVLMLIDNSRLTFLPILLFTLIIQSSGVVRKRQFKVYVLAFLGISLSVLVRAVLSPNPGDRASQAVAPIVAEGSLGGYTALQSIYMLKHAPLSSIQYGATYVLDPLAWMVPNGPLRDSLSHLQGYIDTSSHYLVEKYAPWGGYYYLSETILNFGYIGPPLVTTAYAFLLIYVEHNKNRMRMLYFAFAPTLGILFVKSIFGNVFKLFIIQVIILIAYRGLAALNRIARIASYQAASRAQSLTERVTSADPS